MIYKESLILQTMVDHDLFAHFLTPDLKTSLLPHSQLVKTPAVPSGLNAERHW